VGSHPFGPGFSRSSLLVERHEPSR
jgi:hypothetical protein